MATNLNSLFFQYLWAPAQLGHNTAHSGHRGGVGEMLTGWLIRGFGWRVGASLADSLIHLGIVAVLIVVVLIFAFWFLIRRDA